VELRQLGVLVGRVIVEKSATTLNTASPFTTVFTGATAQNHNDLAGLQGGTSGYYGHTSNVPTSTAFTNYYGDVASSEVPQPKTLANVKTEIVDAASVASGLGYTPARELLIDDVTTATISNVGKMRYRVSGNNSYIDIVMQTGASTYEWVNIVQNNW